MRPVYLGTLGGSFSIAVAVTPDGQFGSSTTASNETRAFSWTPETGMVDLGTLGGSFSGALAASNDATMVGISATANDAEQHAFRWTSKDGMVDWACSRAESTPWQQP